MRSDHSRRRKTLVILLVLVALAAVATGVYLIASRIETSVEKTPEGAGTTVTIPQEDPATVEKATVYYDGGTYVYNDELYTLLILGIDDAALTQYDADRNNGQCDLVLLAVFDSSKNRCSLLQLNRDTMLEVPVPDADGKLRGYRTEPLALAHTYGTGMADSCLNTSKAVSRYLYGITIDNYFALTMDGIPILNDLVGGVTVPVEDDFSAVDATLVRGTTVRLDSRNVEHYVRARGGMDEPTNVNRMVRQRHFLDGLTEGLRQRLDSDPAFVLDAYNALSPSLVTDCSLEELSFCADRFVSYDVSDCISPSGEAVRGERYLEFHADEEQLRRLVLDVFFISED